MASPSYARLAVEPLTEVLPYVAINIPCLPPRQTTAHNAAANQPTYATSPRFLSLPIALLLALSFLLFTSLAIGSNGLNSLSQRTLGVEVVSAEVLHLLHAGRPLERSARQLELEREREEKRQRRIEREGLGIFERLALVEVPPLSAEPFGPLAAHEYASLAVFLIRQFIARPLWHTLLWWHLVCSIACAVIILRLSLDGREKHHLPSLLLLMVHTAFWCLQSAIFGWPAVYLLRQQSAGMSQRTKAS
jgi:hypothetical protein